MNGNSNQSAQPKEGGQKPNQKKLTITATSTGGDKAAKPAAQPKQAPAPKKPAKKATSVAGSATAKPKGRPKMTAKATAESAEKPHDQLGFYSEIYKQVEQGVDGIVAIMPYVENKALKNLFITQQKSYDTLATELKTKICDMGGEALPPNLIEKMMMKGGTMMNTMTDRSESRLAELVMKGVNMGIIALTRLLNECQEEQVDVMYGSRLMVLYEKQIDVLKTYL